MKVLPDSAVWIEYLRGPRSTVHSVFSRLFENGELMLCGPALVEVIIGATQRHLEVIRDMTPVLQWAELDSAGWWVAGQAGRALRMRGEKVPVSDVLIAACAAQAGAAIWSPDAHFRTMQSVCRA